MKRIWLVALCLVVLSILVVGCETETPTKVGESGDATTENGTASTSETYKVGDQVKIGDMVVTLNKMRVLAPTDFDQPQEKGNIFVAGDFTFENKGSEAEAVSSIMQTSLKDDAGYAASQTIHSKAKTLSEGEIGPGQKSSGEIVWEVPKTAKGLQMFYDASLLGSGQIIWDIGDAAKLK